MYIKLNTLHSELYSFSLQYVPSVLTLGIGGHKNQQQTQIKLHIHDSDRYKEQEKQTQFSKSFIFIRNFPKKKVVSCGNGLLVWEIWMFFLAKNQYYPLKQIHVSAGQ